MARSCWRAKGDLDTWAESQGAGGTNANANESGNVDAVAVELGAFPAGTKDKYNANTNNHTWV